MNDNGALLITTRGGIRQLVDGKAEAYALPGGGAEVQAPAGMLRDRDGSLWIGTTDRASCMCTREGQMCLPSLTVSPANRLISSLKIVKAIFG